MMGLGSTGGDPRRPSCLRTPLTNSTRQVRVHAPRRLSSAAPAGLESIRKRRATARNADKASPRRPNAWTGLPPEGCQPASAAAAVQRPAVAVSAPDFSERRRTQTRSGPSEQVIRRDVAPGSANIAKYLAGIPWPLSCTSTALHNSPRLCAACTTTSTRDACASKALSTSSSVALAKQGTTTAPRTAAAASPGSLSKGLTDVLLSQRGLVSAIFAGGWIGAWCDWGRIPDASWAASCATR